MAMQDSVFLTIVAVVGCKLAKAHRLHVKPCLLQVSYAGQAASDAEGFAVTSYGCEGITQRLEPCSACIQQRRRQSRV